MNNIEKRKRGRPRKAYTAKTKPIAFCVTPLEREQITLLAKARGQTVSAWLKSAYQAQAMRQLAGVMS